MGTFGTGVKSRQAFSITISGADTSATATITAVDTDNYNIFYHGQSNDNNGTARLNSTSARLVLTDATTITATRGGSTDTPTLIINGMIEEYYG